jgi:hypothetical protein
MVVLIAHPFVSRALDNELKVEVPVYVTEGYVDYIDVPTRTMEEKVAALKDDLVDDLARKCETLQVGEPDAAMILDTNNEMSLGAWMFQVKTVQHYVKVFEGRDINRVEAIRIAIDHAQARALAKRIIFEEQGGIYNWENCAAKLDLVPEVEVIKKLTQ